MSKFKVGSYVVSSYFEQGHIGRVYDVFRNTIGVEVNYPTGIRFTYELAKKECRIATNNDYLNTLTSNQKANFFYDIAHGKTKINWHDYPNQVHIAWLNKPYDGWRVEK